MEEKLAAGLGKGQISEFVQDDEVHSGQMLSEPGRCTTRNRRSRANSECSFQKSAILADSCKSRASGRKSRAFYRVRQTQHSNPERSTAPGCPSVLTALHARTDPPYQRGGAGPAAVGNRNSSRTRNRPTIPAHGQGLLGRPQIRPQAISSILHGPMATRTNQWCGG
jgi:hypothetical protein